MQEVFRSIKDYEGFYEVSNLGQVKSLGNGNSKNPDYSKERILRLCKDRGGYLLVSLSLNSEEKTGKVSRLVAVAFIPNPKNLPQINHKNSIKTDNRVENLEWCDARHNKNHYYKTQNTTSRYAGVYWNKIDKRWKAQIQVKGKTVALGNFDDEPLAAVAYQKAVRDLK